MSQADDSDSAEAATTTSSVTLGFVWADASRKCQGLAQVWLSLSAVTLTPHVECHIDLARAGEVAMHVGRLLSVSSQPAVPPPRLA